ncbi:MAG: hypothetical protein ACUVT6_08750 [Thermodesulfobacteriota bacterium]
MVWRTIFGVRLTKPLGSSYIVIMDDKEEASLKGNLETEKKREIDLNRLFPGKEYDLNRLFPDEETKRLLYELKRNKRDIERFIMSLDLEEE